MKVETPRWLRHDFLGDMGHERHGLAGALARSRAVISFGESWR
jgi:hypothetical protein